MDEIKDSVAANNTTVGKRTVRTVVGGQVAKKYQLVSTMSEETGISRNHLQKMKNKSLVHLKKSRLVTLNAQLKKSVQAFLEREDNSRMMPRKRDSKTCGGVTIQKRILCDFMYNLYHKYMAENPTFLSHILQYETKIPASRQVYHSRHVFVSKAPKHGIHAACCES